MIRTSGTVPARAMMRLGLATALLCVGCGPDSGGATGTTTVTIFHTTDEHGYLLPDAVTEPSEVRGGAANFRAWLADAGYDPDGHLLLSSGDSWSGPAISTWVEGASTVEVLGALGYDAAAIGNGGSGYAFATFDDAPVELGQHMRDAVIAWTRALMTSASDPIDGYVDAAPRNE